MRFGRLPDHHKSRVILDFRIHRNGWFYLQICQLYIVAGL